jgi:hypothetical protein
MPDVQSVFIPQVYDFNDLVGVPLVRDVSNHLSSFSFIESAISPRIRLR